MQPQLDHIVILVPHPYLADPPAWVTDNFTVSPGGAHADGLTENVLILLADGVYLELIAFVDTAPPEKRAAHRWGRLPYGVIDYAFTLPSDDVDDDFTSLQSSWRDAGVDEAYYPKELVAGARKRPDGELLKWRVGNPARDKTGIANFWCMDVTPRRLRVPLEEKATTHPSGVRGLKEVVVTAEQTDVRHLERLYGAYLPSKGDGAYALGTPVDVGQPESSVVRVQGCQDGHEIVLVLYTGGAGAERVIKGEIGNVQVELRLQ